ncbi:protein of unknown function [Tenacibaculum jejuense]|uniref:Uncharacterized protein n=1 Tax=Tenacibaculum jejuense TaxID=584609 RepID=A0A238U8F3_9FLAO|nr:protein of unknown function [Tenacibaculum jejuense]
MFQIYNKQYDRELDAIKFKKRSR